MIAVTMLAGRRLVRAGRAVGFDRTVWRPGGGIGPHRKAARERRENLRQESQQENWKHQFTPLPQDPPSSVTVKLTAGSDAVNPAV